MKLRINLLFAFCLVCLLPAQAQLVELSYEVSDKQLRIYLQSSSPSPVTLRAINLSLAYGPEVTVEAARPSLFEQSWSSYLEEQRQLAKLQLEYEGLGLSQRFQYGNAEPGLPATEPITVPGNNEAPLLVMELAVTGPEFPFLYLEHQSENPLNQLGDANLEPIDYVIVHPLRSGASLEGELTGGLDLILYPNPARERITLRLSGERNGNWQYTVADLLGRVLLRSDLPQDLPNNELTLQLQNWAEGTYYVNLSSEAGESLVRKFVLK